MKKQRLFTPGPTMVPESVLLEMAQPIQHHRTSWYRDLHKDLQALLRYLFCTEATCITITGSGTAAMEAAIVGCCTPTHKTLVVRNGKFAERWVQVCEKFAIVHTPLDIPWGKGARAVDVSDALASDNEIDTVILVHSETSTTALSDAEGIARITQERGALLLVDGITAVGAIPVKMDEWGVDVYVTGSQKALMLPPGLAFAAINNRAWARIDSGTMPVVYNDLKAYRKSLETFDAPYTPAITLVRGAVTVLRGIKERGLETIWAETSMLARAFRAGATAIGLKVYATDPVDSVTALIVPDGIDEAAVRKTMRNKFGFQIAGGQGELKGKIIRFSHMGYVDAFDTLGALAALELSLACAGYSLDVGSGVAAAQKVYGANLTN